MGCVVECVQDWRRMRKRRQEIEFWQTANGFNRLKCSDADRQ